MTRFQVARLGVAALLVAAVQVAAIDRFLLLGVAYLALPLYLAVAAGSRFPFSNAAIVGAFIGVMWDLMSADLFGRYALALAFAAGVSSLLLFHTDTERRLQRVLQRAAAIGIGLVGLVVISALAGETLPTLGSSTLAGLSLSAVVGSVLSGRILNRVALRGRVHWDPAPVRSTSWVDRRAGIYAIPSSAPEREAA